MTNQIIFVYFKNNQKFNEKLNFYANIQLVTISLIALYTVIPNYDRMMFMFYPMQMFLIPSLFSQIESKTLRIFIKMTIGFIYLLVFYNIYILKNIGGTLPYQTIFKK